jgi:hypothetical protein
MTFRNALLAALALATPAFLLAPAQASMIHKHPKMTGIAAGMVAHHEAKKHGHGFMHKHPMMTGMAAGLAAHHMAKKHGK